MRFSLDSNVLVYAADNRELRRQVAAIEIVARSARRDCVLTPQALAEFFHAATRKGIVLRPEAARQVLAWMSIFPATAGAGAAALRTALAEATAGRLQFYDALLLATARDAGCAAVVSDDMGPGTIVDGVRVIAAFDGDVISAAAQALL